MKTNFVLGIDPGKSGGWVILDRNSKVENYGMMPLSGNEIWIQEFVRALEKYPAEEILVVLEKVHSMPGQGVKSMFTFGEGYGILKGMCQALGFRYHTVTPATWKKLVLEGTKKDKNASVDFARRRFPEIELCPGRKTRPSDGIADALCIAFWGVRTQI